MFSDMARITQDGSIWSPRCSKRAQDRSKAAAPTIGQGGCPRAVAPSLSAQRDWQSHHPHHPPPPPPPRPCNFLLTVRPAEFQWCKRPVELQWCALSLVFEKGAHEVICWAPEGRT
eukprot:5202041-Pyramimonas_sp.AAC.1